MDRFLAFFKAHPVGIAVAVLAVVILIYMMTKSSDSSGGGGIVSTGPSDAAVQANAAVTIAQLQANSETKQAEAAVQINAANVAGATEINAAQTQAAVRQAEYAVNIATSANNTALAAHEVDANAATLAAIAKVIPQTQANAFAAGAQTDAAGYGLLEALNNMMSIAKGGGTTRTLITSDKTGTSAQTFENASGSSKTATYQSQTGNRARFVKVTDGDRVTNSSVKLK